MGFCDHRAAIPQVQLPSLLALPGLAGQPFRFAAR
jgi:hypothetical protein